MNKFDKEVKKLIKIEGLNDPAIFFADYETFEEIPLFSRWKNISFLSSLSFNEKNKFLIKTCLELIDFNSHPHNHISDEDADNYFICLSLTNWDDYEEINCLRPNIFISRKKKWLLSNLKLREMQTIEENLIREYLFSLNMLNYKVFISNGFKENKRVYVINEIVLK